MSSAADYGIVAKLGFRRAAAVWYPPGSAGLLVAALRATLLLALIGASIGLFAGTLLNAISLHGFFSANTLDVTVRRALLRSLFAGAGTGVVVGLVAALRRGTGVLWAQWFADLIAPLGVCLLLPSLFNANTWHSEPLPFLVQLTVATVYLEWAFGRSLAATSAVGFDFNDLALPATSKFARHAPLLIVAAAGLAYAIYFSYFTILNHRQLGTTGYDLGIFVNWTHNAMLGDFDRCTVLYAQGQSCFGGHAIYATILSVPFYIFGPGAEPLLIYQALMIGGAAVTLYLFACTQMGRWEAMVVALAFLMFPPIHGPNFYGFECLPNTLVFYFWLFYAIAKQKPWQTAFATFILFMHREDIAVGITILGLFLALTGLRPRLGVLLGVLASSWFVLNKFILMPFYGESTWFADIYKELQPSGDHTYGGVVKTILSNPPYFVSTLMKEVKLVYFLHMMVPVAFLPLRKPALWLFLIPGFIFTIMTTGYAPTISIAFQYTMHWVPYVFLASVLGLRLVGEVSLLRQRAALAAMAFAMLCDSYVFGAVLQHDTFVGGFGPVSFDYTEQEAQTYRALQDLLAKIPPEASVAATEDLSPHVSARKNSYTLRTDFAAADYLLIRRQGIGYADTKAVLKQAFTYYDYGLVAQSHDMYLFHRGTQSSRTEQAMRQLGISVPKDKHVE